MAKIFVSHSQHDRQIVDFISRVAAGTQVQLIFEELEAIVFGKVTADKIRADIESSNAVFVVVTPHLASLAHSRDWVSWETGVAAHRDVWVFEQRSDSGRVHVVTPALKHFVRYDPSDAWFAYVREIIVSYDDSHVLPAMALGGSIGGALNKGEGALFGIGVALAIATLSRQQPQGVATCCAYCTSRYSVHLPVGEPSFRCPVCNQVLTLQLATPVAKLVQPPAGA